LAANLAASDISVKFLKKTLANYGQCKHLAPVNPTSQTTARVVQTELQPPLHAQLEAVSSQCAGFTVRIKNWFSSHFSDVIPTGYEDETGFHYGVDPRDRKSH
jgi:hypothetical protein